MAQSLFGPNPTIGSADNAEDVYTMATRITFAVAGTITGVRRWGTTNAPAGTPQVAIYPTTGGASLITPENFGAFQANAWNTKMLASPYRVTAGQTLDIAAGPLSRYAATTNVFSSPLVVGDLTGTAGRFIASATLAFPTSSTTTWYSLDVLFEADVTGTLQPAAGAATAAVTGGLIDPGSLTLAQAQAAIGSSGQLIDLGAAAMALSGFTVSAAGGVLNTGALALATAGGSIAMAQRVPTGFRAANTSSRKDFRRTGGG